MNLIDNTVKFIKKNDSKLLLGASIILGGVTIVTTIKSTRKVDPILDEHKKKLTKIKMEAGTGVKIDEKTNESIQYTEKDRRKDVFVTYSQTAAKLGKLYLVPITTGTLSVGCNLASHKLLSDRNFGLQAAVAGTSQAFESYRNFISEKYGKEVDNEAMYGIKEIKKKSKNGEEVEPTYSLPNGCGASYHSRLFDESSGSRYWNRDRQSNLNTLYSFEQQVKRKLKYRRSHTISYNEMMDMLDLDPSEDGNVMGLTFTPGDKKVPLDENGLPDIPVVYYWLLNNGEYTKKTVSEELEQPTGFDPSMLLDFPGLVYIG